MMLFQIDAVSRSFGAKHSLLQRRTPVVQAVDGVSLHLDAGETLGLVGESGSGKSTLGRLAVRLLEPSAGRIFLDGIDIGTLGGRQLRAMRAQVQMVFQDPYGSLDPRRTVGAAIAEPMKEHGAWRADGPAKVRELMCTVGLNPEHATRYPHEFSGGQRQRIGIARALALNPKVLVLDEPVSALDVSIQAQIINLLGKLQRERQLAYLFIAHDLAVVRHVSHRVAVMYLGRIVELAARNSLYASPAHPYTESLLAAVPVADPAAARAKPRARVLGEIGSAANLPGGCRFHPRCVRARELVARPGSANRATIPIRPVDTRYGPLPHACVHVDPALADRGDGTFVACHYPNAAAAA
ncbi:oligopeptide/dipeptide ABC transporter ATP-binding protein [Burkholderia sp. Ax-1724]|uniref:ABC transporter ATP-binding protein n=1 Tax=Burkholderia sp. Ax-1724 TaxID=2608336 RepID=UPI001422D6CB|nr:oligopeptide/dipeptide ABC transporter ATP-binding protein [Burkholderia sp. Ax-1724]NIF52264.1 ATP-binding cassette domain-containing protein [Burkholderia sp. Ax-1724]